ncbi:MAG: glycoside hydrolase family 28 protein [Pirellulales bacterium]|nr:glycoside hydrolase family 28 protein [Pirellulales bacterium]
MDKPRTSKIALAAAVGLLTAMGNTVSWAADTGPATALTWPVPTEIEPIDAPFAMPRLGRPEFPDQTFNIEEFGAIGDGKKKNTEAFRKAIRACSAAGGGRVLVPKGRWFTGPIHLKSNVNLHFEEGAELHFSDKFEDYLPPVFTRWTGFEVYNYSPLIYAVDCENVAVTGRGKLFGHGEAWWGWKKRDEKTARHIYQNQVLKGIPPKERIYGTPEAALRPQFISPTRCKNVLLEGFTVAGPGPFWTMDILYCENVVVRDLSVHTTGGPNTDAINLSSSKNVLVEYCLIDSGDDCVTMKSGLNEEGWRIGRPTENVVVRFVKGLRCHGGIVIGSEMSGGVRNLLAHDCEFDGSSIGLRLKSNRARGGVVEKIWYRDIKMTRLGGFAISINTNYGSYMASKDGKAWPLFRDIAIENVTCDRARAALRMLGNENQPIENITLENVSINAREGMSFHWVNGLTLKNVDCRPAQGGAFRFEHCKDVVVEPAETK